MRIALGTVQFGLDYGIANVGGQTSLSEAEKILKLATESGIRTLDTAHGYGESESVLGRIGVNNFEVVTKIISNTKAIPENTDWIDDQIKTSMKALNVSFLAAVLFHRGNDLLYDLGRNWKHLEKIKSTGLIKKIGVSISSPDELEAIWSIGCPDIVQAPINIFDQRLEKSGWLDRLYKANVEVHARSVFLQGLLLMDDENRPEYFSKWKKEFSQFKKSKEKNGLNRIAACLQVTIKDPRITCIVIGVQTRDELLEIIQEVKSLASIANRPWSINCQDIDLLDPSRWNN